MRALTAVGLAMILLGIAAIAVGVIRGEVTLALLVIIPVIYGSGLYALLGSLLVFLGFAITFFSMMGSQVRRYGDGYLGGDYTGDGYTEQREYPGYTAEDYPAYPREPGQRSGTEGARQRRRSDFGGVVFIGPIPILFGSGKTLKGSRLLTAMAIISAILFALFILGFFLR